MKQCQLVFFALSELYDIYIPSQLSVDVYNKLYMALLRSIKKKENDMMVKQQRIEKYNKHHTNVQWYYRWCRFVYNHWSFWHREE